MIQKIQPINIELDTFQIFSVSVDLDKSASINCEIRNAEGMGKRVSVYMDTETYSEWGNDDSFVLNYALNQLGLVPVED
jgi:hypothetical protein